MPAGTPAGTVGPMDRVEAGCRLLLALVFAGSAVAKLGSPGSGRRILEGFHLPRRAAPAVRLLPAAELAVAVGLLLDPSARAAAAGGGALLVGFSVVLAVTLLRGLRPDCECFGSIRSARIGPWSLLRNAGLLAGTVWVAISPVPAGAAAVLGGPAWAPGAEVGGLLAATAVVAGVLRSTWGTRWGLRPLPQGLPRAGVAPISDPGSVMVTALGGAQARLADVLAPEGSTVLVFIDPGCGPCRSLLPQLGGWSERAAWRTVVVVGGDRAAFDPRWLGGPPVQRVLMDEGDAITQAYGVSGTPTAVRVSAGGSDVEATATGLDAIEALLRPAGGPRADRWPLGVRLTRREALGAGAFATVALPTTRLGRVGDLLAGLTWPRSSGVRCPSCGTCTVCVQRPASGSRAAHLECRPCRQRCSARKLCTGYANQLPAYLQLQSFVLGRGFVQSGDPSALGLEQNGQLAFFGLATPFRGRSPATPRAVLFYSLTNSGGDAYAVMEDARGRIVSVSSLTPGGQLVTVEVPVEPTLAAPAGAVVGAAARAEATVGPQASACADRCETAVTYLIEAAKLLPLVVAPELELGEIVFELGTFLVGQAVGSLPTLPERLGAGRLVSLVQGATFANRVIDKATDLASSAFCHVACGTKLQGCCNYTGKCFDSDALCERSCPGGLAHPLAHCDVYIVLDTGARYKISSLSVPGV